MPDDQAPQNAGQQFGHEAQAAAAASQAVSSAPPEKTQNTPQNAAQGQQQPMPTDSSTAPKDAQQDQAATPAAPAAASTGEVGNVPTVSRATPGGQMDANASIRSAAAEMARKRWANPKPPAEPPKNDSVSLLNSPKPAQGNDLENQASPKGGIKGLDLIPKDWPKLPSNVSLGVEVSWVQSNRLAVVKELPSGGVKVDLTKAYAPAPSMAALSWLETSIRSYAKFIEVASKQASSGQDEAEFVRKERMAIGEIRGILGEMMVDKRGS